MSSTVLDLVPSPIKHQLVEVKQFLRSKCLVIERDSFLAPVQLLIKSVALFQSKTFFREKIDYVKETTTCIHWCEIADPWRAIRPS